MAEARTIDHLGNPCLLLRDALGLKGEQAPFPWQLELLDRFRRAEAVSALDIPTGLGKTGVMAVWLVARLLGAPVPRRLVYVVDRRAVVDQATTEAERLRTWLDANPHHREHLGLADSLPISTLRGQFVDNREWLEDPSAPAIVVGTVDMVGSRLLFEGYRCSRKMRPHHAALLGTDALIVLDEAHLSPAFAAMVRSAVDDEALKPRAAQRGVVPPSRLMALSATGKANHHPLRLGDADRTHPEVKRRLHATKRARLTDPVTADALADTLASKAWELTNNGRRAVRVLVFVDSRKTAQDVVEAIGKRARGDGAVPKVAIETELFVGARRVAEREAAATRLGTLGLIAGSRRTVDTPVFVVATSAGEVGVDLDADHAVLDLVEWERMVQRLGRVNRRGDGGADVWVVPLALDDKTRKALAEDEKIRARWPAVDAEIRNDEADDPEDDDGAATEAADKPVKKLGAEDRGRVERWRRREATALALRRLPSTEAAFDASPDALTSLRDAHPALVAAASTPAPLHPALTRAVVESWSMTSLEEHTGRPRVAPWLRGWVEEDAQTTVVWRTWLPRPRDAEAFFEAAPVETAETLEAESKLLLDWLGKRAKQIIKAGAHGRDEASTTDDTDEAFDASDRKQRMAALGADEVAMFVGGEKWRAWTLAEIATVNNRERDAMLREIEGETVVVGVRLGGLDVNGLLDARVDTATDVGETGIAPLSFRVRQAESLDSPDDSSLWRFEASFVSRTSAEGEPTAWLVVETDRTKPSTTADGRSTGREQSLEAHQALAERYARRIGQRAGLQADDVDLLALAAVLHDEGKRAERWQRAFQAPTNKRPLGKTTSRPIQSILAGYRHELGSLPYAERDPRFAALSHDRRDLVLHLIASHHGYARPLLRTDGCEDAPPSGLVERAREIALRFARLEARWGPWGLAWWETLLRAADQGASRENDARGGAHG
jgi:CRISPR-associated endonuclease/helicase Cas3